MAKQFLESSPEEERNVSAITERWDKMLTTYRSLCELLLLIVRFIQDYARGVVNGSTGQIWWWDLAASTQRKHLGKRVHGTLIKTRLTVRFNSHQHCTKLWTSYTAMNTRPILPSLSHRFLRRLSLYLQQQDHHKALALPSPALELLLLLLCQTRMQTRLRASILARK